MLSLAMPKQQKARLHHRLHHQVGLQKGPQAVLLLGLVATALPARRPVDTAAAATVPDRPNHIRRLNRFFYLGDFLLEEEFFLLTRPLMGNPLTSVATSF